MIKSYDLWFWRKIFILNICGRVAYSYACRYMQNPNDDTIMTTTQSFRKIYLSLYLKGLSVRGSWRPNRTATYWPPHSAGHNRLSFLFSCAAQLGAWGPASLGLGFLYHIFFSNWSGLQTAWRPVFTVLYNSSTPTQSPPAPQMTIGICTSAVFGRACLIVIERK